MSRILSFLKRSEFQLPIPVGTVISRIPFEFRPGIGKLYSCQKKAILQYDRYSESLKEDFIFKHFFPVFKHAYKSIPFYKELYSNYGIEIGDIKSFQDIKKLPIINKKMLLDVPIDFRSFNVKNRILANTGGSSGKTLSFYVDPIRFGNEWAHIHYMWDKLGYSPSDLKLSFDGRSSIKKNIQYDFVRHSIRYNIYSNPNDCAIDLLKLIKKHDVKFLHGYPSAIYNFAIHCKNHEPDLLKGLKKTLKGAFLSSEFPQLHFRDTIEEVFGVKTQSFYGHTETCVMAYEEENYKYKAFQTYGFAEAILSQNKDYELIGTSYFNFASPLIRYNTEDLINDIQNEGEILSSFTIKEGRKGEFIIDHIGTKIPLTGLIFGRHHKLFDLCKHIQVRQSEIGKATILYVLVEGIEEIENPAQFFDHGNVNIQFEFSRIDEPLLTSSGKLMLLIK